MGAAIGIGLIGAKAVEAVGRNPGAFGKVLPLAILGMALAEAIAIYALIMNLLAQVSSPGIAVIRAIPG